MRKIAINKTYGGFELTKLTEALYQSYSGTKTSGWDVERDDPHLIRALEETNCDADNPGAKIKIVEIPDDVEWQIDEYDGMEWVAEKHRTWH